MHDVERLFTEAEQLLKTEKTAQQIIVVQTSKFNVYHCANRDIVSGDTTDEDCFVKMLYEKSDIEIKYIICIWNDCTIDIPSMHLRRSLIDLSPKNLNTLVLLQGEGAIIAKKIGTLVSRNSTIGD